MKKVAVNNRRYNPVRQQAASLWGTLPAMQTDEGHPSAFREESFFTPVRLKSLREGCMMTG